jgi:alkylation response protein AidB-like acyl-CoA dehydrogenase
MDFHFTEEQRILRETARGFLEKQCPGSLVLQMEEDATGFTPELWRKMVELGWTALIIPEQYDGVGGDFLDLVVMLEEMGRACLPGPFFSTVVFGGLSLLEVGSEKQREEFLPKIASGEILLTMAHMEPSMTRYDPFQIAVKTTHRNGEFVIRGTKLFVPDAHVADHIICVTRTAGSPPSREGLSLFLVDRKTPGIRMNPIKTISGDKQFEVTFEDVNVREGNLLGPLNGGGPPLERILEKATVCKCAEMLGGAQKVLEMATGYAKEREQFGRPIGSFQAVQHHCANMLMDIEGSRYITYKTAWKLSQSLPCTKDVAVTKAWVGEAYKRVVKLGHQVQGATAYIIEHDMPLYSRRAKTAELLLGDSTYQRKVVARELGL